MKRKNLALFLITPLILWGCGGTPGNSAGSGGSSSSGSGVSISGTVESPSSSSTSVSIGEAGKSVSKGVSKAGDESDGSRIVVVKAVSDTLVSGGTVTAKSLSGTVLDTGTISNLGEISGIDIDPSQVGSDKQVLLDCKVGENKFSTLVDITDKATGSTVSAGTVDSDSTVAALQVFTQADASCTPDNLTATCLSQISSGAIQPLALFKTYKSSLDDTATSAGTDNALASFKAMAKAFKAGFISGNPPKYSDFSSVMSGNTALLNTWKQFDSSISGIDMSSAFTHVQQYAPAVAAAFDASTMAKYRQSGNSGWDSCAQYFGKQTSSDLINAVANPEIHKGFLAQKADTFIAGDTAAFDSMKKSGMARMMAQFAGKATASSMTGKYDELEKLIDAQASKFDTLSSAKFAAMGEAMWNQMKAADSAAELAAIKDNPGAFMGKVFDNPSAYTGAAGESAFNNQFITFKQNAAAFIAGAGCSVDADCTTAGQVCSPMKFCVATCSANCGMGSKCSTAGQCASGYCSSDGACAMNPSITGLDPFGATLKQTGGVCSANSDCFSKICSSNVCAGFVQAGFASHSGFYKKNVGATCVFSMNVDGPAGSTLLSFGPNDPTNPTLNTIFGGGITFTGSASPFSVVSGVVQAPGGTTGTITCNGTGDSTTLSLTGTTLSGTCVLGGGLVGSCTVDHTKL